jgi:hypothetical protein
VPKARNAAECGGGRLSVRAPERGARLSRPFFGPGQPGLGLAAAPDAASTKQGQWRGWGRVVVPGRGAGGATPRWRGFGAARAARTRPPARQSAEAAAAAPRGVTAPSQWLRWRRARDCTAGRRRAAREGRRASPALPRARPLGLRPAAGWGIGAAASAGKKGREGGRAWPALVLERLGARVREEAAKAGSTLRRGRQWRGKPGGSPAALRRAGGIREGRSRLGTGGGLVPAGHKELGDKAAACAGRTGPICAPFALLTATPTPASFRAEHGPPLLRLQICGPQRQRSLKPLQTDPRAHWEAESEEREKMQKQEEGKKG